MFQHWLCDVYHFHEIEHSKKTNKQKKRKKVILKKKVFWQIIINYREKYLDAEIKCRCTLNIYSKYILEGKVENSIVTDYSTEHFVLDFKNKNLSNIHSKWSIYFLFPSKILMYCHSQLCSIKNMSWVMLPWVCIGTCSTLQYDSFSFW